MEPSSPREEAELAQRQAREAARQRFAAGTLELERVLELYARHARSSLGRRVLAERVPLSDEEVREAIARVGEVQLLERARDPIGFGGVTDPLPLLAAAHAGPLDEADLGALRGLLGASERLGQWLAARREDCPALARTAASLPDLSALWERLGEVVDERGRVRDTASPTLSRLRVELRELSQRIDSSLRSIAARPEVRPHLTDGRVHLRGGRQCLAVKAKASGRVRGIVHDRSQSEQTAFVEPQEIIEPANRLSEARHEERRELTRILSELAREVLARAGDLGRVARALGEVELAMIGASYAAAVGARMPRLAGDPGAAAGLLLRGARHPLLVEELELGHLEEVVPIDLRLGEEFDMLILTGPNTGGKTLALKTAGLFALLVRLGLPVPCEEGTTIPLYDGVAADIGDEQEISQSLSTFSSHVTRIREGLARATARTLVLLDELGGGTDPDEGAALGEALLEVLLSRGTPTLVSTHLGRLKEFAFRHARVENACTEFDLESLAPRYRVLIGVPGESAALVIAERLGLDADLVARARERLERRDEEVLELMAEVRQARTEAERARGHAEARLEEAAARQREVHEQEQELARSRERLEAEAQRGLEERVREARDWLGRAEALLPQLAAAPRQEMEAVLGAIGEALGGASLTERRGAFLARLKKGDLVYLPRYRRRCPVHRVLREAGEVVVKLGGVKLTVDLDEVTEYESL